MFYSPFDTVGNIMFSIIPIIVIFGFIFVFGMIIVQAVKGASQWNKNNNAPVLSVKTKVVSKRADVSMHHNQVGPEHQNHSVSSSTSYFITFEVESGDRMEFLVPDKEYGMLIENDMGMLTFQGTRYLGFERQRA